MSGLGIVCDQTFHVLGAVGVCFRDRLQHVGFGFQIRACRLLEVCVGHAGFKPVHRGLHRALSLQQEVRPRDGQLKPCPQATICGGFWTIPSRVVIFDCSSRFVSSCSTRSTARIGS